MTSRINAPRRLLHVTTVPDSLIFFDGQIAFMKRHGYEISMAASAGPVLEEFGKREGVAVYPIEMPRRMTPGQDARSLGELHRLIRRLRPDIVHSHTAKGGLLGMLAAALARTPVRVYQMRGLLLATAEGWKRGLFAATEILACGAAHQVLCNSRSLRDTVVQAHLCPPGKIDVLLEGSGNGVDSAGKYDPDRLPRDCGKTVRGELGISDTAKVVGFVGRLVRDKGVRELLEAWQMLREKLPDAHLLVVGPFEPRDPVSPEDRKLLETDPRIRLLGFRKELAPLYAAMDVLALPTYREGFPNVLLEAQSMRLPVVSTRVDGCVDAVEDGVTGTLVAARDSHALGRAILAYLESPELRARHGNAGRSRVVRSFDRERLWEALLNVYEAMLANADRAHEPLSAGARGPVP